MYLYNLGSKLTETFAKNHRGGAWAILLLMQAGEPQAETGHRGLPGLGRHRPRSRQQQHQESVRQGPGQKVLPKRVVRVGAKGSA